MNTNDLHHDAEITVKQVSDAEVRIVDGTLEAYLGRDNDEHIRLPEGILKIENCYLLRTKSVIIPEGVTEIGNSAFSSCEQLEMITLPSTITTIGESAFSNCTNLKSIILPQNVKTVENSTFEDCSSLMSIILPEGLESIGFGAFKRCSSLKEIIIPDSVNRIWDLAFAGCHSLSEIKLPKGIKGLQPSVFLGCEKLGSIDFTEQGLVLDDNVLKGFLIEDEALCAYEGKEREIVVPDCVKEIGEEAFCFNSRVTSVTLPESVEEISYAAFESSGLESITILNSEISIDETAFDLCVCLKSVNKPDDIDDYYFEDTPWFSNRE